MTVLRMLVVDDDPAFLAVIERGLQRRGIEVRVASEPEAGLGMLQEFQPQRILLDLNLSGRSGLLALPDFRAAAPQADIVILTGYSSIATAVRAIKQGATNYLCKPATVSEVMDAFDDGEADARQLNEEVPDAPLSVDRLEWEYIQKTLDQYGGNVSATAKALGMHRRTLQRKLAKRPVRR
ncbi:MAG: response regulator [Pseudomonadota bacterium]